MTRSEIMSRIRSTGNRSTELTFCAALRKTGATGWRIQPRMEGRPDVAFPRDRVAVFLDGCFWHGCIDHYKTPKTNARQWTKKIRANMRRDVKIVEELAQKGWKVFRIWEHDIQDEDELKGIALRVARAADTPDTLGESSGAVPTVSMWDIESRIFLKGGRV